MQNTVFPSHPSPPGGALWPCSFGAVYMDMDGLVRHIAGPERLPKGLSEALSVGASIDDALGDYPALRRHVALSHTVSAYATTFRIGAACWRFQSVRCGLAAFRSTGVLLLLEHASAPRTCVHASAARLAGLLGVFGERGVLHDGGGAPIVCIVPGTKQNSLLQLASTAPRPFPHLGQHHAPLSRKAQRRLGADGWCVDVLSPLQDHDAAPLLAKSFSLMLGGQRLTASFYRPVSLAGRPGARDATFVVPASGVRGTGYKRAPAPDFTLLHVDDGYLPLLRTHAAHLMDGAPLSFEEMVHPRDVERYRATIADAERRRASYAFRYLLRTDEGQDVHVIDTGRGVYDVDGNLAHIEGVLFEASALEALVDSAANQEPTTAAGEFVELGIIGRSRGIREVIATIRKAATSSECVLIQGESGSGKELAARALHTASARAHRPFIAVNCGAIPECLMESEFFGHRKGAFSGADRSHAGLLEQADGGTLFLDEVGEIPQPIQVKLLRAIEGGGFSPVGDARVLTPDIRIVAATNRNLAEMVAKGAMRRDFYYRINILPLTIPPLRERREDVPLLLGHFLEQAECTQPIPGKALTRLMDYPWPGNVRELRNVAMRYATLGELPAELLGPEQNLPDEQPQEPPTYGTLKSRLGAVEKAILRKELDASGWKRTAVARRLGIDRRTLYDKMQRYSLKRKGKMGE